MIAERLLTAHLPTAHPDDESESVLELMEQHFLPQLPLVSDAHLLGLVSAEQIQAAYMPEKPVGQLAYRPAGGLFVYEWQHLYDVINLMAHGQLQVVPVLSPDQAYVGGIVAKDLLSVASELLGTSEPGGTLVLEIERQNYQLREIASVVEGNNARVLNLLVSSAQPNSQSIYVTLKLNVSELTQLIHGFDRYGYKAVFSFSDQKQLDDTLDRYQALIHYLNM